MNRIEVGVYGATGYPGLELIRLLVIPGGEEVSLVDGGIPAAYDESAAIRLMQLPEWELHLDLGKTEGELWTCDLSEDYIRINGHYRT